MVTSTTNLLSLPPELLVEVGHHLQPHDVGSLKLTHSVFDGTLSLGVATLHLLSLPPELILEVADHLPPDAILALKLTHPWLNDTLLLAPRPKKTVLSSCARLAVRTYLSRPNPKPSHIRCILCKAVYPTTIFNSSSSPACVPLSFLDDSSPKEVVELPQRFCAWHVGRLAKIVHTERGGRNEWVSQMRRMCMHCGSVQGWGQCDCSCDSCWYRNVRTYTRYLNNTVQCRRFLFWRDVITGQEPPALEHLGGRLYVREFCWDPGKCTLLKVIALFEV